VSVRSPIVLLVFFSLALYGEPVCTYLEAKHTGACLVKSRYEGNVEAGAIGTNSKIDVCQCPGMAAIEDNAATCQGPLCAICGISSGVETGARECVLIGGCLE
jgi:hypothetical protein